MTKTKRQLRAEAVERLVKLGEVGFYYEIIDALCDADCEDWSGDKVASTIRDLLTDDDANDDSTPEKVVSGYGADFNVAGPNLDNLKAVEMDASRFEAIEMDASRLVVNEPDSREKLEADVLGHVEDIRNKNGWTGVCATYGTVIRWLDRQSAITQHEITERLAEHLHPIERECGDLRRKVTELTAERDNWKAELIDERSELNRQINTMRDVIRDFRNERDHYRSKFGKCLDYADAIHALMDDEGMA